MINNDKSSLELTIQEVLAKICIKELEKRNDMKVDSVLNVLRDSENFHDIKIFISKIKDLARKVKTKNFEKSKEEALLEIIEENDTNKIEAFLNKNSKFNINYTDGAERSPLSIAVRKGNLLIVKKLLNLGSNPNISNQTNNILSVALLMASNAFIGSQEGRNEEQYLLFRNYSEIIKELVRFGANPFTKDKSGTSPIDFASWARGLKDIETFLRTYKSNS